MGGTAFRDMTSGAVCMSLVAASEKFLENFDSRQVSLFILH